MGYFLKQSNIRSKGLYLQIYQSFYVPGKGGRNKSYKVIGYASDLIAQGISDPVAYAKGLVDQLNNEVNNLKDIQISDVSLTKRCGHFLLSNMFDFLDIDHDFNALCINKKFHYKPSDLIRNMCYAQVLNPSSKYKAFEKVIPSIYKSTPFSYDQILDGINFIGNDYEKFIEVLNHCIEKKFGKRKVSTTYFDCTNYYFEIDLAKDDKQRGPSKERRTDSIIGQALLLDENQIPIAMKMYPGNCSEKPFIRETITDMKQRYDITGKIVQIVDKGLNCAQNIYSAAVESNDGYIFSKTFRSKGLSKIEKEWMLLDNSENVWTSYTDDKGNLLYKLKEAIDTFDYNFDLKDENGKVIKNIKFSVKEKRVVTFNPSLAKKQIYEINREVDKLSKKLSVKGVLKEKLGDVSKYVDACAFDRDGELVNIETAIDFIKVEEAKRFAGYNLLVTSEINKSAKEIYEAYHGLWRIEESFRIMKSYLESRPVFVQLKETIYGHFLICYIAFTITRLIEFKLFNDEIPASYLYDFMRNFNMTQAKDGSFINASTLTEGLSKIKKDLNLRKLSNAYLSKKDVDLLFDLHLEDYFDL